MSPTPLAVRLAFLALALLAAAPAHAQWQRIDANIPVADLYGISFVASDDAFAYAAMLAGQPVPNRLVIARSGDDGSSWEVVFTGYPGARFASIGTSAGGRVDALVTGGGVTGLLTSADHGATWAEVPARLPTTQLKGVARMGDTVLLTGGNTPYRSTNGGASWTALDPANVVDPVAFGGTFYALTNVGQPRRLVGSTFVDNPFGQPFATHRWVEGGLLWTKASAGALYASPDGTAWTARPTATPTTWGRVDYAPDDARPWFLNNQAAALDLLLSTDQGATATSVVAGYPRDSNGGICLSNFALSRNAVIANPWGCFISGMAGLYRYGFGATAAEPGASRSGVALTVVGNPVRDGSTVRLTLDVPARIDVALVDALGRRVATLAEGEHAAGDVTLSLPAGLAPGVYAVRAVVGGHVASRMLTVVR